MRLKVWAIRWEMILQEWWWDTPTLSYPMITSPGKMATCPSEEACWWHKWASRPGSCALLSCPAYDMSRACLDTSHRPPYSFDPKTYLNLFVNLPLNGCRWAEGIRVGCIDIVLHILLDWLQLMVHLAQGYRVSLSHAAHFIGKTVSDGSGM